MTVAVVFPGQGAQKVGMGKSFADNFAISKQTFEEADDLLERRLSKVIFEGPEEELTATHNSQLALFVTSVAMLRALDIKFDFAAGLSLGEYTALCAAGKLSFEDGLKLVEKRGRFMSEACENTQGAMAAIIGLEDFLVDEIVAPIEGLWVANYNCPGQVVISGTPKGVEAGCATLKESGAKRAMPLKVHGAFHSGLMEPARQRLIPYINDTSFVESSVKVAMNVTGGFEGDVKENLALQVTQSVRWHACITAMAADRYIEIGPGKTLAGMNRRIGGFETLSIENPSDFS